MPVTRRSVSLVVIALTLSLAYGVWYAYSVILVALLQEFGWSRSVLAGAFSAFTLVHGAANPLVGTLCDRVRPLQLMAGGGALLGLALWADSYISTPWQLYLMLTHVRGFYTYGLEKEADPALQERLDADSI